MKRRSSRRGTLSCAKMCPPVPLSDDWWTDCFFRSLIVSILTRFSASAGDMLSGDVKHSTHSGVIDDSGQIKFDMSASLKVPQPHLETLQPKLRKQNLRSSQQCDWGTNGEEFAWWCWVLILYGSLSVPGTRTRRNLPITRGFWLRSMASRTRFRKGEDLENWDAERLGSERLWNGMLQWRLKSWHGLVIFDALHCIFWCILMYFDIFWHFLFSISSWACAAPKFCDVLCVCVFQAHWILDNVEGHEDVPDQVRPHRKKDQASAGNHHRWRNDAETLRDF